MYAKVIRVHYITLYEEPRIIMAAVCGLVESIFLLLTNNVLPQSGGCGTGSNDYRFTGKGKATACSRLESKSKRTGTQTGTLPLKF